MSTEGQFVDIRRYFKKESPKESTNVTFNVNSFYIRIGLQNGVNVRDVKG